MFRWVVRWWGIWSAVVVAWEECNWNEEYDDEEDKGRSKCYGTEAADNIVTVSMSWRCNMDGSYQWSSFVVLHLFIEYSAHNECC